MRLCCPLPPAKLLTALIPHGGCLLNPALKVRCNPGDLYLHRRGEEGEVLQCEDEAEESS